MEQIEILTHVEKAIATREASGTGKWNIAWVNSEIVCVPTTEIPRPEIIFTTLSELECTEGLSSKMWNRLNRKILEFFKQKGLLCNKSKF